MAAPAEAASRRRLTLAEEVLLLALDDAKGSDRTDLGIEAGLAGAILLELVAVGCLRDERGSLVPTDCEAPAEPLLAEGLELIRHSAKRRTAKEWVKRLRNELRPLRDRVARGLVEGGILEEKRHRTLGLIPTTRYPERDPGHERLLRERLREVLLGARDVSSRDALLLCVLEPYGLVKGLVPRQRRREAGERARAIAKGEVGGSAVDDALKDMQAAAVAAIAAGVAAATVSGDGGAGDGGAG